MGDSIQHLILWCGLGALGLLWVLASSQLWTLRPPVPVDTAILGTWRCLGFDEGPDSKPVNSRRQSRISDRRYSKSPCQLQQDGDDPDPNLEAYASIVRGQAVLNVRIRKKGQKFPLKPLGPSRATRSFGRKKWCRYKLVDEDKRSRGLNGSVPESFRRAFEAAADQADLYGDFCACVKVKD